MAPASNLSMTSSEIDLTVRQPLDQSSSLMKTHSSVEIPKGLRGSE